jgi:hypothetical protein
MDDPKEKAKLLNQIKVLKMKLRKANIEKDQAFVSGFEEGFDHGMLHQLYAEELEKFKHDGEGH